MIVSEMCWCVGVRVSRTAHVSSVYWSHKHSEWSYGVTQHFPVQQTPISLKALVVSPMRQILHR